MSSGSGVTWSATATGTGQLSFQATFDLRGATPNHSYTAGAHFFQPAGMSVPLVTQFGTATMISNSLTSSSRDGESTQSTLVGGWDFGPLVTDGSGNAHAVFSYTIPNQAYYIQFTIRDGTCSAGGGGGGCYVDYRTGGKFGDGGTYAVINASGGGTGTNLLQNGSFEQPGGGDVLGATGTFVTGWVIPSGKNVDYLNTYWTSSDGTHSIDLDGTPGAGAIAQTFATTAGTQYTVTFDMAGNPNAGPTVKQMQLQAAGQTSSVFTFDITGKTPTNMGWVTKTWCFTASSSSTTLEFDSLDGSSSNYGPALDNVRVTAGCTGGGGSTGACSLGTNLIVNGDAESNPGATDWAIPAAGITSWKPVSGTPSVSLCKWGGYEMSANAPGPSNRGTYFFCGGAGSALSQITQSIDTSSTACAQQIDQGNLPYTLDGWLGSGGYDSDSATLTITFRGASAGIAAAPTLGTDRIGPQSGSGLTDLTSKKTVPTGTRSIDVLLQLTRNSGSDNDGDADNLSFVLGSGGGSSGGTLPINLATGLNASNTLITAGGTQDGHWIVDQQGGGTAPAEVVASNNADYFGSWVANGPNSAWIARKASTGQQGSAPYAFTRTFDLTGIDLTTVSISGSWAIDDTGTLSLNGNQISTASAQYSLKAFSVPVGSAFFKPGVNSLTITMTSSDNNMDGVRLEGSVTGSGGGGGGAGNWTLITTSGDCSGGDVSSSSGSSTPDPTKCTAATNGTTAVCWAANSSYSPNTCTYKSTLAASCTGGSHPGSLYRCDAGGSTTTTLTVSLAPSTATNPVGTSHTVTATVKDQNQNPVSGVSVTFTVLSGGPNAGTKGTATTNSSGQATFTYTGSGGAGTDSIQACIAQSASSGLPCCSTTLQAAANSGSEPVQAAKSANVVIIGAATVDPNCYSGANVVINDGCLAVSGPAGDLGDFKFSGMAPSAVNAANLAQYDTAVLNVASTGMNCNTTALTASQKTDLVNFVGQGKKLIIYDSECPVSSSQPHPDYSWLPYPFSTSNPGAQGAAGTLNIVENDFLTAGLDAKQLSGSDGEIGDMNVMTTKDPHWSLALSGTNALNVTGPVVAYAKYPAGTDSGRPRRPRDDMVRLERW